MIQSESNGAVCVITINNGRLNVLTREMHESLYRVLLTFLRDDSLKVAVLTTLPGTSFSAGDDLKTADDSFGDKPDWSELVMTTLRQKPIIGAVRGHCLGQGLVYLLLLTDIRFAAPTAKFGFPEIRKGMGGAGLATRLSLQIPSTVAMHMVLTGESLSADAALNCHLINDIVEDDQLMARALQVAEKIAESPLVSIKTEMWPGVRQVGISQHEAIAQAMGLWDVQRRT